MKNAIDRFGLEWQSTQAEVEDFYDVLFKYLPRYSAGAEAAITRFGRLSAGGPLKIPQISVNGNGVRLTWRAAELVFYPDGTMHAVIQPSEVPSGTLSS